MLKPNHAIAFLSLAGLTACFAACSSSSEPTGSTTSALAVDSVSAGIVRFNRCEFVVCSGATTCVDGACTACGQAGEPACAPDTFQDVCLSNGFCGVSCIPTGCDCNEVNLTVIGGTCIPCGANGEVACQPVPSVGYAGGCNEGSVSVGGTCGPCGADGQPACQECGEPDGPTCPLLNNGCNVGTVNVDQTCECGALNQIACVVGNKCDVCASGNCPPGVNQDGSGVTVVVGSSGAGTCEECGLTGQPACSTPIPGREDGCTEGVEQKGMCVACGEEGQPTCSDGLCKAICPDKSCQGTFNPNLDTSTGKNVCTATCGYAPTSSYDMPCTPAMVGTGLCTAGPGGQQVLYAGEPPCFTETITNGQVTESQYSCYNHSYVPISNTATLTGDICQATPVSVSTCPVASVTLGGSGVVSEVFSQPYGWGATCQITSANGSVTSYP